MPLGLTPAHLILILVIALIVVGPGKLPDVGAALGKSIKEFRKAASDIQDATSLAAQETPVAPAPVQAAPAPAPVPAPVQAAPVATVAAPIAATVGVAPAAEAVAAPIAAPVEAPAVAMTDPAPASPSAEALAATTEGGA